MRSKTTQTARIRKALKAHADKTPKQIADQLGISPRAVHMVKYLDKKRASQKSDALNHSAKRVSTKKETWAPSTPAPEWVKPKSLSKADEALKAKIEEIAAREPDHGKPMALWEIVVICLSCAVIVNLGMALAGMH